MRQLLKTIFHNTKLRCRQECKVAISRIPGEDPAKSVQTGLPSETISEQIVENN